MADKAWKAFERRVATFFGSTRNSLSGMNSKVTASDSLHPELFIECKLRAKFAHHETLKEATSKAIKEDKIPIVVTQKKYDRGFCITVHEEYLFSLLRIYAKTKGYSLVKKKPAP